MSARAITELCRVVTSDGLPLEGLLISPEHSAGELPVSAMLLVHGTGSHFYASGVLETFADQALNAGLAVLRINTRGHDVVTRIAGRELGAAYETISDCRLDLAAWIEFLVQRGHERIGLVGHSMGGVKAIYAQAQDGHPAVQCVVGISPPRFCHERLTANPACAPFREDYQKAKHLVAEGKGRQLMSVRQPLPMLLTAEGFLAKYGPHDHYDFLKPLPHLRCPGLILIGSKSAKTSPAFMGVPEDLRQLLAEHPDVPLSFELIEGADTAYSNCQNKPFDRTLRWLRQLRD